MKEREAQQETQREPIWSVVLFYGMIVVTGLDIISGKKDFAPKDAPR